MHPPFEKTRTIESATLTTPPLEQDNLVLNNYIVRPFRLTYSIQTNY